MHVAFAGALGGAASSLVRPLRAAALLAALGLSACAPAPVETVAEEFINGVPVSQIVPGYGLIQDGEYTLPPVPPGYLRGVNRRAVVTYTGTASPGTIEIDPYAKFLYWVEEGGTAVRYPIAVGREGLGINGSFSINRKAEWPGWTPTANMLRREPEVYGRYAGGVPGGLASPLGARALYLYRGGRDSYYRIHGTNDLSSIGNSGSAGCIRLFNHDAIDLFDRVPTGTRVVIRSYDESVRIEGPVMANRGINLPPFYLHGDGAADGQRPPVDQAMVPEELYGNPAAQAGITYVADPADPYRVDPVTGDLLAPPATVPDPNALPLVAPADVLLGSASGGVEMVGAGYAPGGTVPGDASWPPT